MRLARRLALGTAAAIVVLALLATIALVVTTQSAWGRDRVRRVAEGVAARYLTGSLRLGALRFEGWCGLSLDSLTMLDASDSVLVTTGPVRARCRLGDLVAGRIALTSLSIDRPRAVLREEADGEWNWTKAFREDTTPPDTTPRTADALVVGQLAIRDGTILLEMPWAPDDTLQGAARDSAVAYALARTDAEIRRARDTLVRRRRWTGLRIDAPKVRAGAATEALDMELARLDVDESDPPFRIRRAAGRVRVTGDSAIFDLPRFALNEPASSRGRARGAVSWGGRGPIRLAVDVDADTVSLADVHWIAPEMLPATGGGRMRLRLTSSPADADVWDYALRDMDVRSTGSHLTGAMTFGVGAPVLVVKDVDLRLDPLDWDLVRVFAHMDSLPTDFQGTLEGYVRAPGGPLDRWKIADADIVYRDTRVRGAVSRLRAHGELDMLVPIETRFRGLVVEAAPLDLRSIVAVLPDLPPLTGTLAGTTTLDSIWTDVRLRAADFTYREGRAQPLRMTGGGRVTMLERGLRYDLALTARPLAFASLGSAYPELASLPPITGPMRIRGTLDDLSLVADIASPGGTMALVGRFDLEAPGLAWRGTARAHDLNLRAALARPDLPSSALTGTVEFDVRGDSLADMTGRVAMRLDSSSVAGLAVYPSAVEATLGDRRLTIGFAAVATAVGDVNASGAIGLAREVRDTIFVVAATDSLSRLVTFATSLRDTTPVAAIAAAVSDSAVPAPRDTVSRPGQLRLTTMVVGSVDSLDVDADVIVADYATPAAGVRNAHLTVSLADLPKAVRGRATLEVDTLHAGGLPLYGLHADAEADRAFAWRFAARTADEGRAGGALRGSVTLDDALVLALDTMALRVSDLRARLVRPTRLVVDSTAIRLDTLDLRTAEGGSVLAAAVLPDTGAADAVLRIADLPLRMLAPAVAALDSSARLDLDLDARLTGTRARPRIAVDGGLHTGQVAEGVADSIGVRVTYADRHADLGASVRASGRSVATARLALPVEIALDSPRVALLDSAMSGEIRADSVALPDLERFFPQLDLRSGVLRSNVVITGTPRQPNFVGTLSLGDGVLRSPELGVGLRDAQALIVFREDSVHVRTIRANADREMERGLGTVALNGEISVRELRDPTFDLRLRATQMPVARMERVADLDVSADLRLRGRLAMPVLSGRITVDRGELRIPELAGTVVDAEDPEFVRLVDSLTSGRTLVAASPIVALARDLVVEDVRVTMGNNVWLRSAEMNMALGGSVELARASATFGAARAGALALSGELRTLRGTYTLDLGVIQRTFQLEEGSLTFRPQPVLNPDLDINVVHVVQRSSAGISSVGGGRDVRIRAHVGGTLLAPTLELSSAGGTRMSQEALLSYLVTGRETLDLGNLQGSQFVTGELVTRMTGAAANWLAGGFFDVVTVTGGSTEGTESGSAAANAFFNSRIGLGKQVTDRVFITLNAGVCDLKNITGGGAQLDPQFLQEKIGLSVEYRLPRRLTLAAGSEPAASAAACGQQGATGSSRTAITVPRQLTFDVSKAWRF